MPILIFTALLLLLLRLLLLLLLLLYLLSLSLSLFMVNVTLTAGAAFTAVAHAAAIDACCPIPRQLAAVDKCTRKASTFPEGQCFRPQA